MRLPFFRTCIRRPLLAASVCAALSLVHLPSHSDNLSVKNLLNSLSGNSGNSAPSRPAAKSDENNIVGLFTRSFENVDEPREIEIGQQLAAILLGSKPLSTDMALQRYVNELGRWISLQSDRPHLPWTFAVLDDPGYNAFAAPGGYVFVTKGLIDRCADEAELAGILAHEITHVTARHHLSAMRKSAQSGVLTRLVASQIKSTQLGNAVASQMLALGRDLYARGLDQGDEYEADRTGVALATRAGFDPYGLVAVLQRLRTAAPDNPLFALSLATHPPAQARLDQLELAMGSQLDAFSGGAPITLAQRLAPPAAAAQSAQRAAPAPQATKRGKPSSNKKAP